jgi:integrase
MGDSGLRRDEAAHARRENLRLSPHGSGGAAVWALTVIGKRRKQRTVPVSAATVGALREHWTDRGRDFDAALDSAPLIVPLVIPGTGSALKKHGGAVEAPYTSDAYGRLVRQAIQRLTAEFGGRISRKSIWYSSQTPPRTRSGTPSARGAVARDMPIDVVQTILGHASLQTTSIYVRAEQQRMLEAAAEYYAAEDD